MDLHDDVLIRLRRRERADADAPSYSAEMELSGGRRISAPDPVRLGPADIGAGDARAIAAYGADLYRRLFGAQLASALGAARAAAAARQRGLRLRLALDPADPALHAIPWELLHLPGEPPGGQPTPLATDPQIIFSRYIDSADFAEASPADHRPIRMLVALSEPTDLARWDLAPFDRAETEADLVGRFAVAVNAGQFSYDVLPVASQAALQSALERGGLDGDSERGYDVLLYMGHALYNPELGSRLVLEQPGSRGARLYSGDDLTSHIRQLRPSHRPAMVALVACNSAAVGASDPLSSLAARLVTVGGVPAVLAMQRLVEIALARSFTQHLTEMLLRNGVIDMAVNAARRRVYRPDSPGWSTPVLYMRNASGRLFSPNALLSYVEQALGDEEIRKWAGPEYIDVGALAVPPGQDWRLLRVRPEDAPAVISARESLIALISPQRERRRDTKAKSGEQRVNLIALIGSPQSGQTTILRRVSHDLAAAALSDVNAPVGVLISLAGYEQVRGSGRLERHIIEQVRLATPAFADLLADMLRTGATGSFGMRRPRLAFLLDNLEATPESARPEIIRDLDRLAQRLGDQIFIIASPRASIPIALSGRVHVLVLQPLSEQQIARYLRQRDAGRAREMAERLSNNRLQALAADPSLLALIYDRLSSDPQASITRNQVVEEFLARELGTIGGSFSLGNIARESLDALAWHSRWNNQEQIELGDLFRLLAEVRRERDYRLEELYDKLTSTQLLTGVGQQATRFANSALHAYCAAVALIRRPDRDRRLADIITLCGSPERQRWWEEVVYALAGMLGEPELLLRPLAGAIRGGSDNHALIAARCLEALPSMQEARLKAELRNELVDACLLRLSDRREPIAERREQIVTALGRLSYPQVRSQLRRVLVSKTRQTASGPRYEYTNVRIAAARALRNIYLPAFIAGEQQGQLISQQSNQLLGAPPVIVAAERQATDLRQIRDDGLLAGLMQSWLKAADGRADLRELLLTSPSPPERAIAAFALGDISDSQRHRVEDARFLLRIILSPTDDAAVRISEDWEDTMWAAADALTLFEPDLVVPLLTVLVQRRRSLPNSAAQQLAYLAGRLRANSEPVISWLITTFISNGSQSVKAKALQSLAWMGGDIPRRRLALAGGQSGPTLKQLIEDVAAWRRLPELAIGSFAITLYPSDSDGAPFYLRRKAIEALAWVGDGDTLRELRGEYLGWPIELREYWYSASASIQSRLSASE